MRICFLFLGLLLILKQTNAQQIDKRILVFSKTTKYYHESIPTGMKAIQQLGKQHHFAVDTSTNATVFNEDNLKKYAAIVLMSPGGDVLDTSQQADIERFIQAGGGYVGIHAATTMEYGWPWYGKLAGAVFDGHPQAQDGVVVVVDSLNPATSHLPKHWKRFDEWYNFKNILPDLHILLTVDESTYTGGKQGEFHPVAWYHEFDGGRSFYTALGHYHEAYSDPLFLQHILAGIQYAIGNNITLNYSKSTTHRILK